MGARHVNQPVRLLHLAAVLAAVSVVASSATAQQPAPSPSAQAAVVAPPAVVMGRIVGADKKGMEEVEVLLDNVIRTFTDRKGRFEFDPVSAGPHEVVVRHIGFSPIRFRLTVTEGDIWDGNITMQRSAQTLPDVVVLDSAKSLRNFRPRWIDGFVERRRMGAGTFLDRIEIESLHASSTARLIMASPGVTARQGFGYDMLNVNRCGNGFGTNSRGIVYVDGFKTEESTTGKFVTFSDYPPERLAAIEIYKGHNTIPARFDDPLACFVVLLWTTRR